MNAIRVMFAVAALVAAFGDFSEGAPRRKTKAGRYQVIPQTIYMKFEGDIRESKLFSPTKRNAVHSKGLLWPSGVVPYSMSQKYDLADTYRFKDAMKTIEDATSVNGQKCIQFVPRMNETNYVHIEMIDGCWSDLGRQGRGQQSLSLEGKCATKGTAMHELLHTLGFYHEQSRADRDHYIEVHYDNIIKGAEVNFKRYALGTGVDHLNQPYDYDSIMHYGSNTFAKDRNLPTISTKTRLTNGVILGQRDHLSVIDIKMIQLLYGCQTNEEERKTNHCRDKLANCNLYGEYACEELPDWAAENCARTCGVCEAVCEDKLNDCEEYTHRCGGEDLIWAEEHCAKTCKVGVCEVEKKLPDCADRIPDCVDYGEVVCTSHRIWAMEQCSKFCEFCISEELPVAVATAATQNPTTPKPITTVPPTTRRHFIINVECVDRIHNCKDYGKGLCSGEWSSFMRRNCPDFCGFCGADEESLAAATTTVTSPPPSDCSDSKSDCAEYGQSLCLTDPDWAKQNCANFCDMCAKPKVLASCKDVRTDCYEFEKSQCGGQYTTYMKGNCASYCDYC